MSNEAPHIMVIESRYFEEVADELAKGAIAELAAAECTYERFSVPGVLEIPAAIRYAVRSMDFFAARRRFDGYVILGCVSREPTGHYASLRDHAIEGIQELVLQHTLALGNGIITVDNSEQAMDMARVDRQNHGGQAALACMDMIDLKSQFRLYPR